MKSVLLRRTSAQEVELWKNAIFVFDSSALLNFYEYSETARQDIYDNIFPLINDRLWITNQTEYEFLKHREKVMQTPHTLYKDLQEQHFPAKHYRTFRNHYQQLKSRTAKDNKHPYISPDTFKSFDKTLETLEKEIEEIEKAMTEEIARRTRKHTELMKDDKLLSFFKVTDGFSFVRMMDLAKEGEFRYRNRIPPGYADQKAKAYLGLSQYGDLIIWKQTIAVARSVRKPIILIIDDLKEDWCYTDSADKSRIVSPREELIKEMKDEGGVAFWAYSSSQFLYNSKNILKLSVKKAVIDEVSDVAKTAQGVDAERAVFEWAEKNLKADETIWAYEFGQKDTGADIIQSVDGSLVSIQVLTGVEKTKVKEFQNKLEKLKVVQRSNVFGKYRLCLVAGSRENAELFGETFSRTFEGFDLAIGYINEQGKFTPIPIKPLRPFNFSLK